MAAGHRAAACVLDGREHGATLDQTGLLPSSRVMVLSAVCPI